MCAYSPNISVDSADFTLLCQRYLNSLLYSQNPWKPKPFTQYQFSFHQVPITAWRTEAAWIPNLHKAFTHDQRCGNWTPDLLLLGPVLNHSTTYESAVSWKHRSRVDVVEICDLDLDCVWAFIRPVHSLLSWVPLMVWSTHDELWLRYDDHDKFMIN